VGVPGASTIHSDSYKALLALVRDARVAAGLSQTELAERLGRHQSWVSKVEVGERRLDLEELRQMCDELEIDLVRLVRQWLKRIN
jgi:ribosome-binding protein aMBF1 (putative translation factor)